MGEFVLFYLFNLFPDGWSLYSSESNSNKQNHYYSNTLYNKKFEITESNISFNENCTIDDIANLLYQKLGKKTWWSSIGTIRHGGFLLSIKDDGDDIIEWQPISQSTESVNKLANEIILKIKRLQELQFYD